MSELDSLKDFFSTQNQAVIRSIDGLKDEVHDLARRMQDDHDKIIRLEGHMDTLNKSFDENKAEEERYGRQFAKELESVANSYSEISKKQAELETTKAKDSLELWKKVALFIGAGGLGTGGLATALKAIFGGGE